MPRPPCILAATLAALGLLGPGASRAQDSGETSLAWGACAGAEHAVTCAPFDCAAEGGSVYVLVGTFELSVTVAHAISMTATVDVDFPTRTSVPEFWDASLGGCNPSSFVPIKGAADGCETSLNAFCGGDSMQCDLLYSALIAPGSNRLRIALSLGRAVPGGVRLEGSPQRYYAFSLGIPMIGALQCQGCGELASAVWNSATIYALDDDGVPLPPITLIGSGQGAKSRVGINDKSAGCVMSPVRPTTWGQLKSLFR